MAVLERLGQFTRQVVVVEPAERRVHRQEALVDRQQRELVPPAPEAERFGVAHLGRIVPDGIAVLMAAHDDTVVPFEDFAPRFVAGRLRDEGGIGPGGGDGTVITGGPQTNAAAGFADLGTVDGNAKMGVGSEHERTPFLGKRYVSWRLSAGIGL